MGYFNNINLLNFRNFENYSLNFSTGCNVLYGKNGTGKTNILESISLFSKGRGLRKDKLSNIIKKNSNKFIIKSDFQNNEIIYNLTSETLNIDNKVKKVLLVNRDKSKESIDRIYKLITFLYFLPETERLFLLSPSFRRNFIDQLIFTYKNNYNKLINQYTKYIQERSKILSTHSYDESWLIELEKNISKNALEIYSLRGKQVKLMNNNLNDYLSNFNLPFKINIQLSDKFYKGKC